MSGPTESPAEGSTDTASADLHAHPGGYRAERRVGSRVGGLPEVDLRLLRRLQVDLGHRRQHTVEERRRLSQPELAGEDAVQHGKALIQEVVTAHEADLAEQGEPSLTWEARQDLVEGLEARLFGAGSLQQLLEDDDVEDIVINGYRNVYVYRADGTKTRVRPIAVSNEDLIETIQTLAAHEGLSARAFDAANVRVTLRLPDGSRLHAVQGVTGEPSVAIRKHRYLQVGLKDLVAVGTIDEAAASFLRALIHSRKNLIIAGETGAGKTTLLRALAREIDPEERLITVERSLELGLHEDVEAHPDCLAFEEREPNAEGIGAEPLRNLVRDSLRMRPDRVFVGEVLGDEIVTMLNAMTQGNNGSLSTIHANSAHDVPNRINTYAAQAPERLPWEATVQLIASALDFIVFVRRILDAQGARRRVVASVVEVRGLADNRRELMTNEIYTWDPATEQLVNTYGVQPACIDDLTALGWASEALGGFRDASDGGGRW